MSVSPGTIRKAAILITSLDQETADQLLEQMPPEQAQIVRNAALDLGELSNDESSEVIAEFLQSNPSQSGVELDQSLADKLVEASELVDIDHRPAQEQEQPFLFLHDAESETLTELLRWEHPQTIAVVLSHLPPNQGMEVLVHFPDQLQSQILQRMVSLEQTNPKIVRNVEQELERVFSAKIHATQQSAAGLVAVQAILKQADAHHRQHLLKNMSSQDRQRLLKKDSSGQQSNDRLVGKHRKKLADFLQQQAPPQTPQMTPLLEKFEQRARQLADAALDMKPGKQAKTTGPQSPETPGKEPASSAASLNKKENPTIHFDHLTKLDTNALTQVLQTVEPRVLLLALLGASPELMNRITAPLSTTDNRRLRRQMEQIGPLQLQDITTAQDLVAKTATRLIAEGRIQWPIKSRFAATA
ncbi:MAG: FliG C-terminal domain-containing protein [Pirellulaceae bacterium]